MYVITAVAMAFIKCSLACLYKRVFVDTLFATIVNVFMVVIVIWALAVTFGIIFGCGTDFGALFPGPGGSLCRPYYNMGIAAFSIDIVLDIGLVILPLPIVWLLNNIRKSSITNFRYRYGGCRPHGRRGLALQVFS